jgi:hypothetical protein
MKLNKYAQIMIDQRSDDCKRSEAVLAHEEMVNS